MSATAASSASSSTTNSPTLSSSAADPATADTVGSAAYDIVILGGGSGGYACAFRAAELGLSVALVERDKLGGTCLHRGCIPTKALLHAAEVADTARGSAAFGVNSTLEGIDMPKVQSYKNGVINRLFKGLTGLAKSHDVKIIEGEGRLVDAHTVSVNGANVTGRHVVLASGSTARTIPGIELGERIMTSDGALELDTVPGSVIVLGGGVIGVEFASVFASFGAKVTVVEALDRLVPAEEPTISATLLRAFKKRKIDVRLSSPVKSATATEAGVQVTLVDGMELSADLLLVAVGRGPASAGLGYEEAGVKLERGCVVTDARLRTGLPGMYAVGDLVAGPQLAHRGFAHGIFVAEDIAGLEPSVIDDTRIPKVTYCEPEIASVGLTEAQAKERGHDVQVYEYNLGGNGKSQILQTQGFVRLVRSADGPVLGIHMIGARMSEQIGEAQVIVGWDAYPDDVAALIHAHPTQNEALGEAHLALAGKPLHAHA